MSSRFGKKNCTEYLPVPWEWFPRNRKDPVWEDRCGKARPGGGGPYPRWSVIGAGTCSWQRYCCEGFMHNRWIWSLQHAYFHCSIIIQQYHIACQTADSARDISGVPSTLIWRRSTQAPDRTRKERGLRVSWTLWEEAIVGEDYGCSPPPHPV